MSRCLCGSRNVPIGSSLAERIAHDSSGVDSAASRVLATDVAKKHRN